MEHGSLSSNGFMPYGLILVVFFGFFILAVDYLLPREIAIGTLYSVPILLSCLIFKDTRLIKILTLGFSLAIIVGFFISPSQEMTTLSIVNRSLSITMLFFVSFVGNMLIHALENRKKLDQLSRDALNASPSAMILTNSDGTILLVNKKVENIFGYSRDELLQSSIDRLVPNHSEKKHPELRRSFFKNPQSREMGAGRELFGKRKDGSLVPVEIGLTPVRTIEGNYVVSSVVDISKRKIIEKKLEESHLALQKKNSEMEQFLYIVSHDLNTPVVTLKGLTGLLKHDINDKNWEEVDKSIQGIDRATSVISDLLNDLLEVNRVGRVPLQMETTPIDEVIQHVLDSHIFEINKKSIDIRIESQDRVPILADRKRLLQVLDNLVSNAIKYGTQNPHPLITIGYQINTDHYLIYVKDNGGGIPKKYHEKIFKLFERIERKEKGTGAGLFIVKKITELNGGEVWVESEEGKGTIFWISLPLYQQKKEAQIGEFSKISIS